MQAGDSAFAGSIPALYDRYLGPALFDPYAADLARRVANHARACDRRVALNARLRLPPSNRLL